MFRYKINNVGPKHAQPSDLKGQVYYDLKDRKTNSVKNQYLT